MRQVTAGTLVRRKDDEPEAIRNRLAVYERRRAPVLDWYRAQGTTVATIDAVGSVQDVTAARARGAGDVTAREGR